MQVDFIFAIAILIMSVVVHEVSHGFIANALGDPTAKYAGRLTLNPLKHLDFFGSILVPAFTYLIGGFIFGWAKPVPYNPYNLRDQKWGPALVGIAGPASNIFLALVFGLSIRIMTVFAPPEIAGAFLNIAGLIVLINLILAIFNLLPVPPLDGSKVLFAFLPYKWTHIQFFLERYGFFILLIFIIFFWRAILPVIFLLFRLFAGAGL
jgi:Zn-dependent protease